MNRAIENMVKHAGMSLTEACDLATINPARALGMDGEAGSICEGKRADFAVLDDKFNVLYTVCGGKIIYKA
jgi:N-acetylglucosamine-6-phosphate deacetylase